MAPRLCYTLINGKNIAYLEWMPDHKPDQTMLCVHGINRNKRDFDYLAKFFCGLGKKVIAFDMPGRGQSEYLTHPEEYNYSTYLDFTSKFIEKICKEEVIYVGTSMGGIIGILLLSEIPHKIKSIVLNDIGPYTDAAFLKILYKYLAKCPEFCSIEDATRYLKVFFKPLNITQQYHLDHMIRYSLKKDHGSYLLDFDYRIFTSLAKNTASARDLWQQWNQIDPSIPILVLRGKNSNILSEQTFKQMLKSRKRIAGIEYENVGHVPSLMEEEQLNDIKDWLLKVEKISANTDNN